MHPGQGRPAGGENITQLDGLTSATGNPPILRHCLTRLFGTPSRLTATKNSNPSSGSEFAAFLAVID
jgi:hypothetical protein